MDPTLAPTKGNTFVPQFRDFQQDDENLRLLMSKSYTDLATSINYKVNGVYTVVETQNGKTFNNPNNAQSPRYAFQKIFYFGSIAAPGSLNIAHGLTGVTSYTNIYGSCITATDNRPIPHASVTANANIEVIVGSANITINNGAGGPAISSGMIVLEYLKQ